MAFAGSRIKLMNELKALGAKVQDSRTDEHYLVVNDEYEICYTSFFYRRVGDTQSMGRGKNQFFKLVAPMINPISFVE